MLPLHFMARRVNRPVGYLGLAGCNFIIPVPQRRAEAFRSLDYIRFFTN